MKKLLLFLAGILFFLSASVFFRGATERETQPLRIGVADAYPPMSFSDGEGRPCGFDPEFARALCRGMQRSYTLVPLPLEDLLEAMRLGHLDLIVAGLNSCPERERYMAFSDSYFHTRGAYLGRSGLGYSARECITGKRLGVQANTMLARFAQRHWAESTELVLFPSFNELIDELCAGRVDVALVEGLPGYGFLRSERGQPFTLLDDEFSHEDLTSYGCIAVRKDSPELLRAVNRAIIGARLNGEYDRIARTYFPFNIY